MDEKLETVCRKIARLADACDHRELRDDYPVVCWGVAAFEEREVKLTAGECREVRAVLKGEIGNAAD